MSHSYAYAHAANTRLGRMICDHCGQPISSGEFRHRETPEKFILHHRGCSLSDPQWSKLDAGRARAAAAERDFQSSVEALMKQHGIPTHDALVARLINSYALDPH